ncbi:MAG: AAA family ATPase, partial [Oligoflexales bacterium]|nr:AAA family ATPase [Oligoflexales bacterium]
MLTNRTPFTASDVIGYIHAHIALSPEPIHKFNKDVPEPLVKIVGKLMAKSADDRYQSSRGLIYDLQHCLQEWQRRGAISPFDLGSKDVSERLEIPQKLYGREGELSFIKEIFEQVRGGWVEFLMVSGFSGIGKSSLINELYRSIVASRGFFIKGKFDQFSRDIPYSALSKALSELAHQILSLSSPQLSQIKQQLVDKLSPNGKIITDIVPAFEAVIGQQPSLQALGPTETQNRCRQVLTDFFSIMADVEHPLVMFIDDLQWSDVETLNIFVDLGKSQALSHLFIIGTYRDNEVSEGHLLTLCLDSLRKTKPIHQINLHSLPIATITEIISDTLHRPKSEVQPLADLIFHKTDGNPFFLGELLKNLYVDGKIHYNRETGVWDWNLSEIEGLQASANIVQFLVERVRKLDQNSQKVLSLAACIGNLFDFGSLVIISDMPYHQIASCLQLSVEKGIIVPLDTRYRLIDQQNSFEKMDEQTLKIAFRFQHDQIQKACYSLISEDQIGGVHLNIARMLHGRGVNDSNIIDIVRHYNVAITLICERTEKIAVIRLNLNAAQRSRLSNAYQPAANFLKMARTLITDEEWQDVFDLVYEVYFESVELAFLCGQFKEGDEFAGLLLAKARSTVAKVKVIERQSVYYANFGNLNEGVRLALKALSLLGIKLPMYPSMLRVFWELFLARWAFLGRNPLDFFKMKPITSEKIKLTVRLLVQLLQSAYLGGYESLYPLCIFMGAKVVLQNGNCPEASGLFVTYSAVLSNILGDIRLGRKFAELAKQLIERNEELYFKGRSYSLYSIFVAPWQHPFAFAEEWCKRAMELNYQAGNQFDLASAATHYASYFPTENLQVVNEHLRRGMVMVRESNEQNLWEGCLNQDAYWKNLRGLTSSRYGLSYEGYNEYEALRRMYKQRFFTGVGTQYGHKAEIAYARDKYAFALAYSRRAQKYKQFYVGTCWEIKNRLYDFLINCECLEKSRWRHSPEVWLQILRHFIFFWRWGRNNP